MARINKELIRYPEQFVAYLRSLELRIDELERELTALKRKQGGR